ncbi:MAG: DUF4405 domain-containing protein [Pirellulales bacterium]|nr:DUF4405 domain-containing protein [Pirellulales bacterium]
MKLNSRGFTSLLLSLAFLMIGISGAALYGGPQGRVAYWTDWTMLGLSKEQWESVHVNVALLILIVSVFHLYFNWKPFIGYIKAKATWHIHLKREIVATMLIISWIVAGSIIDIPPFSMVMQFNANIQAFWEQQSPKAPAPHAEEFSVNRLARTIGLSVEEVMDTLNQEGFDVDDQLMSIRQIGKNHGVAPSDVYAAITKHYNNLQKVRCGGQQGKCTRANPNGTDP